MRFEEEMLNVDLEEIGTKIEETVNKQFQFGHKQAMNSEEI